MNYSRRHFLGSTGMTALASLAAPSILLARLPAVTRSVSVFRWQQISDAVRVAFEHGGNAMTLSHGGQTILIDCKNAGFGGALRRESGDGLALVVNTHHHADHTGGNTAFTADLPVYAHEKCRPRVLAQHKRYIDAIRQLSKTDIPLNQPVGPDGKPLATPRDAFIRVVQHAGTLAGNPPDAEQFAPTHPVGDHETLTIGDLNIDLHHVGPGHTDNDVFVHVPALNLLHTGDLLFHRLHPFLDRPAGATTSGWMRSAKVMIELCNEHTVVVPGHGEITDVSGIREQIAYFEHVHGLVGDAIKAGQSKKEIQQLPIERFADYGFKQIKSLVLGVVYDELTE
jgi:glyoxylase-like metal-dependent hydrolase (beta-lactamase superfamily II)